MINVNVISIKVKLCLFFLQQYILIINLNLDFDRLIPCVSNLILSLPPIILFVAI